MPVACVNRRGLLRPERAQSLRVAAEEALRLHWNSRSPSAEAPVFLFGYLSAQFPERLLLPPEYLEMHQKGKYNSHFQSRGVPHLSKAL